MRVQCGMKIPDRGITRVGNKMCGEGGRERGGEKRGRRQRKYSGRLGCTRQQRVRHCASLYPAVTCFARLTRPEFPSIAISDAPLVVSLAIHHALPSPTPQTRAQLHFALPLTADCSRCLLLEIDVASIVRSASGKEA